MHFKRTKTYTDTHGNPQYSVRLVKNQRIGGKVKQTTMANLGTKWDVPQTLWGPVAQRVEELMVGQDPLVPCEAEVEQAAEEVVKLLRSRGIQTATPGPSVATVDLNTMEHRDPRFVGGERLCLHAWEELRLRECLQNLGFTARDTRISLALLTAKMLHPGSERETSRWLKDDSATAEILGLDRDSRALSRKTLYRIGDKLWKHQEALQRALFERERILLDIPNTIVFYDLSNTYYTGTQKKQDTPDNPDSAQKSLLQFGRSKQRRNDCPLITLGLMLDEAGFPRGCEFLPGNVTEVDTLKDALGRFEAQGHGTEGDKPTVIMDAGISAQENLDWLTERGYPWLCVAKGCKPSQAPDGDPELTITTQANHTVRIWKLDTDADETRLYVMSEGRQQTARSIRDRQVEKFEDGLQRLHDNLSVPRRMKKYERIVEAVGRLKERHSGIAQHYTVQVQRGEGTQAKAVKFTRKASFDETDEMLGACILRTSHTDWDLETVLRTYHRLVDIEAVFRELKGELGLRPIWHTREDRIQAHLFLAVLAYHAVQLIRTRLRGAGTSLRWQSIRRVLRTWIRVTTTLQTVQGKQIVIRQDVHPSVEQTGIVKAAGVKPGLHRVRMRQPV